MEFGSLIEQRRERLGELDELISTPDFYSDAKAAAEVMREHTKLKKLKTVEQAGMLVQAAQARMLVRP